MAFQAFNFGKQLGLVGGGQNSPSTPHPISGHMAIPIVETETWTGGGGHWVKWPSVPSDNPLDPFYYPGDPMIPGGLEWHDGPEPRNTRTRTVPGTYHPWEVPKVIDLISESNVEHPYWVELCDGVNRQTCSREYVNEVMRMISDILDPPDFTDRLYQKFYWILECMRNIFNKHQIKFSCCPGKPLADDRFLDASWREEIIQNHADPRTEQSYGIVWLDPDHLPTRLELIRALTMRCGGYDGMQNEWNVNDVTAYLIAGEKPPCTLLQAIIDSVPKFSNMESKLGGRILDKYFTWDPRTGKIYFRLPNGSADTTAQMNIGEESYWKCKVVHNSNGTYRYKCCD